MKKLNKNVLKNINAITVEYERVIANEVWLVDEFSDEYPQPRPVELKPFMSDYSEELPYNVITKLIAENKLAYEEYKEYDHRKVIKKEKQLKMKLVIDSYLRTLKNEVKMTNKEFDKNEVDFNSVKLDTEKPYKTIRQLKEAFIHIVSVYNGVAIKIEDKDMIGMAFRKLKFKEFKEVKKVDTQLTHSKKWKSLNEYIADLPKEDLNKPYKELKQLHLDYLKELKDNLNFELKEKNKEYNAEIRYRKSTHKKVIKLLVDKTNMTEEQAIRFADKVGFTKALFNTRDVKKLNTKEVFYALQYSLLRYSK